MTSILNPDNRLFTLARLGRRPPSALAAIAVVFIMLALVLIPGQMLARFVVLLFPSGIQSVTDPISEIIGFLSIYLGLWVCLRFWSKRPFWSLGFEQQCVLQRVLRGGFIAGLMVVAMVALAMIPGASVAPGELRTKGLAAVGSGLLTLLATSVQSSAEEALFRGWLLSVIGSRYGPWIGVMVSSLVFAMAHALNGPTLLGWLNLFLFGIFAAFYALSEGGLWGICVWHAVWNWAMGDLLGFATDGVPHTGLLISIRATGPDIVTGGAFGLEGGVAVTAVFLIAIGIIVMRTRRSGEGRLTSTD